MGMMLTFSAALAVLNLQSVPAALLPEAKPMAGVIELIGINNGVSQHYFDEIDDQRDAVFRKGSCGEWIRKRKLLDRCVVQGNATPQRVYNCSLSMRRVVIGTRACPRRG
jgi:hypothetical protein